MMSNMFIQGDFRDHLPPKDTSLMIADPVYGDLQMIKDVIAIARGAFVFNNNAAEWTNTDADTIPSCIFMAPADLVRIVHSPDQICYWVKPVSTKNTTKRYSSFVEIIAMFGVKFHKELHWSNRTGIFTDTLLSNKEHPWKKPESLIEKLILNHYPGHGVVYDPCAGSRTVETVCKRLGIPSFSVEIQP